MHASTKIETSANPDSVSMIKLGDDLRTVFLVSKLSFYLQVFRAKFSHSSTEMVWHRGLQPVMMLYLISSSERKSRSVIVK